MNQYRHHTQSWLSHNKLPIRLMVITVVTFFLLLIIGRMGRYYRRILKDVSPYIGQTEMETSLSSIHVPDPQDVSIADNTILIPKMAREVIPGVKNQLRVFDVLTSGESGKKIIVYKDDVVRIHLLYKGTPFRITIPTFGIHQEVDGRESRLVEFQAGKTGTFEYAIGGENKGEILGNLVIVPRT